MSFFAVLYDPPDTEQPSSVEVLDFHCAVAQIGCFFGNGYDCDIGLRLRAVQSTVKRIKVLLPFELDDDFTICQDLHPRLNQRTAKLIFGRKLDISSRSEGSDQFLTLDFIGLLSEEE